MSKNTSTHQYMRIIHRYLGFFLAGIMVIYSVSGIVLIFRKTDFLKNEQLVEEKIEPNTKNEALGKILRKRDFKPTKEEEIFVYFEGGKYNKETGELSYTVKELPTVLKKLTHLHKATTKDPLYWLNIFFGLALLFFSISAFWMYMPSTKIFRKGLYFSLAGMVLVLILLFF